MEGNRIGRFGRVLPLIVAVLLLADSAVVVTIGGGVNLGTLLPGLIGVGLVGHVCGERWLGNTAPSGWRKRTSHILVAGFLCWLVSFVVIEGLIAVSAFPGKEPKTRWLVVLGAGLRGDRPSLTLAGRLATGLDYLQRHRETRVLVSGGQGFEETMTEATAMQRFLVHHGIASERIIKEEESTSTMENLRLCKALLERHGMQPDEPVGFVSSDFHMFRVKFLARRVGLHAQLLAAKSPWYLLPNTCTREYFAVIKSLLIDR
jgi:uncharacterized SAM-binding protein YcdF (DUF218 family)